MLNKNNERELAYVVIVDAVTPIEGYDRVELAHVGGWTIVVGKGEFCAGDPAIYFEIDSKLPEVEPFTNMEFLAKKKYKIKTQKMCKSISQGLLMSAANFGWSAWTGDVAGILDNNDVMHTINDESRFLTKQLGVTYAEPEDNARKAAPADKYKKMTQRHPNIFKKSWARWMMRRDWGRKVMFFFFGKAKDKKSDWPAWVKKTDEERIENMSWILKDKSNKWIATEKIDGTSTTFTLKRKTFLHPEKFYICSRNVVFDKPNKKCFYATNVYTEMAEKYHIYDKMKQLMKTQFKDCEWITIQGETYGPSVQKRDYHAPERGFMAFNFITSKDGRWNSVKMKQLLENKYEIPCVPILCEEMTLPDTIEELRAYVNSTPSMLDHEIKEGIVFRTTDGVQSFKCVSPEYLLKYHG